MCWFILHDYIRMHDAKIIRKLHTLITIYHRVFYKLFLKSLFTHNFN